MRNVVLNEIKDGLNLREKFILKVFTKTFNKVYNITRINTVNKFIK